MEWVIVAARLDCSERNAYVMVGDAKFRKAAFGKLHGSSTPELGNLKLFVDCNRIQNDDFVGINEMFDIPANEIIRLGIKEIDGHDMESIVDAIDWMDTVKDKPAVVIVNTVKGKYIIQEDNPAFHGAAPSDEQLAIALSELGVSA